MVFKTNSNYYLYSKKKNKILLIHPLLAYIIKTKKNLKDKNKESNTQEFSEFMKKNSLSRQRLNFYLNKYRFLKENGYFDPMEIKERIDGRYTGNIIKEHLPNNRHIVFEVTDACNLKCKYCGYGELYSGYDKRKNQFLSIYRAKTLLDYMASFWNSPKNFHFNKEIRIGFYGGEPLLNFPFIERMVQYAKRIRLKHNYFTFGLTTNGVLLDKYIDYFVDNRFHLLISLDGDKECNGFRLFPNGEPAFETIYKNICLVRKQFPEYYEKYVGFAAVLHRLNSVERIYDFFKTHFNKIPGISDVSPFGIKESTREAFNKIFVKMSDSFNQASKQVKCEAILSLIGDTVRKVAELLYFYSDNTFKSLEELLPTSRKSNIPTGACAPLNRKIFLNVNGKILPCERVSSSHVLGTVTENQVRINFEEVARKYNHYFDQLADQCLGCYNTRNCSNCILHMNIEKDGFKCPFFTDQEQSRKLLSETMGFLEENPELYKKIVREYFLV